MMRIQALLRGNAGNPAHFIANAGKCETLKFFQMFI